MTKKKPNIKIFTAFHKEFQIPNDEYHIPVHVWKALGNVDLPFLWDDTWDNISLKNPNYCELTMLYWVRKNYDLTDVDYIWLAHYRRLFDTKNIIKKTNSSDIVVPKKLLLSKCSLFITLESLYKDRMIPEDFDLMKDIMYSMYPEYKQYDYVFTTKHLFFVRWYFCNMFIMNKKYFYDYCKWLFSILFELEKKVQISQYYHQARIFWIIGEWMFNIWIEKKKHEKIKICDNKVIYL